jgi:hypothetical protein
MLKASVQRAQPYLYGESQVKFSNCKSLSTTLVAITLTLASTQVLAEQNYRMVVLVKSDKLTDTDQKLLKTLSPSELKVSISELPYSLWESKSVAFVYPKNLYQLDRMEMMTQGMIAITKAMGSGKLIFNLSEMAPSDANAIRNAIVASSCIDPRYQILLSKPDFKFAVNTSTAVQITDGQKSIMRHIDPELVGRTSKGMSDDVMNSLPDSDADPNPEISKRLEQIRNDLKGEITTQVSFYFSDYRKTETVKAEATARFSDYISKLVIAKSKEHDDVYSTLLSALFEATADTSPAAIQTGASLTDSSDPTKQKLLQAISSHWDMDFDSMESAESFSNRAKVAWVKSFMTIQISIPKLTGTMTFSIP